MTHQGLAACWPPAVRVLPDLEIPARELWLVCHDAVRLNTRTRRVMDYLAQALTDPYAGGAANVACAQAQRPAGG